jgi:hypothetical protein
VSEHVGVHPWAGEPGGRCEVLQPARGSVSVQAVGASVEQEGPCVAGSGGAFDGWCDRRG